MPPEHALAPLRLATPRPSSTLYVDLVAERAVLAAPLLDNRTLPRIAKVLDGPGDFHEPRHGVIWEAFLALWEAREVIDVITVVAQLRAMERLNTVGGAQYIGELTDELPTVAHCESHARLVADAARARRYAEALDDARGILSVDGDPARALERAMARVAATRTTRRGAGWKSMQVVVEGAWDRLIEVMEGRRRPVPTGFATLDGDARWEGLFGGGMIGGELVVVAADQAGGKTAFALQMLRHAASQGFRCLLVSQEMDATELHWRMACALAGVQSTRVRAGRLSQDDITALQTASTSLRSLPIRVCDTGSADVADIRVGALDAQAEGPVDLIVVDYLQILDPPPWMGA